MKPETPNSSVDEILRSQKYQHNLWGKICYKRRPRERPRRIVLCGWSPSLSKFVSERTLVQTWQQLEFEDCGWDCLCQWGWNWLCSQQLWPLVPALLPSGASCFHLRQLRKGDSRRHTFFISPDQLPVNWSPHIRLETNTPINILITLDWHLWKGFNDLILLFLVLCFCHISELTKSTSKLWS